MLFDLHERFTQSYARIRKQRGASPLNVSARRWQAMQPCQDGLSLANHKSAKPTNAADEGWRMGIYNRNIFTCHLRSRFRTQTFKPCSILLSVLFGIQRDKRQGLGPDWTILI